ncbi:small acid-soluble spore protein Tlp [Bacillus sp. 03113]|uniref:small acid-soluble spore protein Tlp n=1 Tax=Bacillus sp. 03113 TaxID=2578211 RepID=UPI0011428CDF|nr:small acid-soluble spore protein Tlp [Bacillus sp. 03113]
MTWDQPNPDDRSDNVAKLQSMINDTIDNFEKAENSLKDSESAEQSLQIQEKNKRRENSINAMRAEIEDESNPALNQSEF